MFNLASVGKFFSKEKNVIFLLLLWIIVLSVLYSTLSITRHNHFESGAFDLGIYDQGIWLYSQFDVPYSTIKERFLLGDHLTLTLPFLAPLFYIWNDVRLLLIFQAFFITFSAVPVYLVARIRKLSPFSSLIFAIIYSLFYGIQFAVYFDFHPVALGVTFLAWLIYFYEARRVKLFVLSLVLLLLTQENMGLTLASIGFVYLFSKRRRKHAVLFILSGVIFSLFAARLIGFFSPVGYEYFPKFNFNPLEIIQRFFDAYDKKLVWLYSFSWFSFLPLLHPGAILGVAFDLAQYFQPDKQYPHMITPFFHHRAILAPILALATLDVLSFLNKKGLKLEYLLIVMLFVAAFFQLRFHFALNKLSKPIYHANRAWMDDNRKIISLVPKVASVTTQQNLVPHLSHRKEIYLAWPRKSTDPKKCLQQKECWWLDFAGKPQYLVVDTHEGSALTQLLESRENFVSALSNMQKTGKIRLFKLIGDAAIYKIVY